MQISEQSEFNIISAVKKINEAKPSVLYFADSLGAMNSADVSKCIKTIKSQWARRNRNTYT